MYKNSLLTVVVRNKDNVLYSGQAYAVTATNDKGPFDILGEHESFISLLKDKIVIHMTQKTEQQIQIENGIVRVYRDKVYIYVNFKS
jgi:F0F1-type ATP synthase epsilon subunit